MTVDVNKIKEDTNQETGVKDSDGIDYPEDDIAPEDIPF